MGLRLLAMVLTTVMFALVKIASDRGAHVVETLFYRQLFSLPVIVGGAMIGPGLASLTPRRMGWHASRATVGMIGMVFYFMALAWLPLAEVTTIGFTVPMFATILSALVLREYAGFHRWSAVILGFIGVLIIAYPGLHGDLPLPGLAAAIGAALFTAIVSILLRRMGRTEAPTTIAFWFAVLPLPVLGIMLPFFGSAHSDPMLWAILAGCGLVGGFGQLCLTGSLRWGAVSLVLPMDYSSIVWATALGWVLWGNWPGATTWIGTAIIIASGLYIVWREHVRAREGTSTTLSASP